MPFLVAEILNFQGSAHHVGVGSLSNYIQNYMDGKISRAAFWELAKFRYPTHQISFHTISALDTLTFIGSEVVYGNKK